MSSDENKREFFRLDSELVFDYEIINESSQLKTNKPNNDFAKYVALAQALRQLDVDNAKIVDKLKAQHPTVLRYFEIINQKIELAARMLMFERPMPTYWVNLSAGGLAFWNEKQLEPGTQLCLRFILQPNYSALELKGEVIESVENAEHNQKPYRISVRFHAAKESEQQLIMQHNFHMQAKMIREQKKYSADDDET